MAIEFKVHNPRPWSDCLELYIAERFSDHIMVAHPLTMRTVEAGEWSEPSARMTGDAAQQLMDELWRCGLRPSEGSGSAGSLAATERHLADMRELAFSALKVKRA